MKDVTAMVDKTPFKNKTYTYYATGAKDDHPGLFYTPHSITNWFFDAGPRSWGSFDMLLHDMCHVIDLYKEGEEHRLLRPDFGWTLQDDNPDLELKVPARCFIRELRVVTMQDMFAQRIFGKQRRPPNSKSFKAMYRRRTYEPLLPGREWNRTTAKMAQDHEDFGVVNYLKVWKAACRYVKSNR